MAKKGLFEAIYRRSSKSKQASPPSLSCKDESDECRCPTSDLSFSPIDFPARSLVLAARATHANFLPMMTIVSYVNDQNHRFSSHRVTTPVAPDRIGTFHQLGPFFRANAARIDKTTVPVPWHRAFPHVCHLRLSHLNCQSMNAHVVGSIITWRPDRSWPWANRVRFGLLKRACMLPAGLFVFGGADGWRTELSR